VEIAQTGIQGVGVAQPLDVRQGVGRLLLTVEDNGQVVPGGVKAGRQVQAVFEQAFGVGVTAEPRAGLGQHAHGGHVGGMGLQALAQQVLGHRQAILDQGQGRDPQSRVPHAGLDVAGVGLVGAGRIAQKVELFGDDAPGVRQIRPQGHGVAQGGEGGVAVSEAGENQSQFEVGLRRLRLFVGQRLQHVARRRRLTLMAQRRAQQHPRARLAGKLGQHFARLPFGEVRTGVQQAHGVRQGLLERRRRSFGHVRAIA